MLFLFIYLAKRIKVYLTNFSRNVHKKDSDIMRGFIGLHSIFRSPIYVLYINYPHTTVLYRISIS